MRVTPWRCVPLANACKPIYTGSKRTSGRNHHVRPPFPVWRKRYINLNLWGPCLKWSLKSRSPQHDSEWQQSQRICGSLSKYIGLSSYRIYAIPSILSSRSPHKRALLSTSDILRLDAFYALPRLVSYSKPLKSFFKITTVYKLWYVWYNKKFSYTLKLKVL